MNIDSLRKFNNAINNVGQMQIQIPTNFMQQRTINGAQAESNSFIQPKTLCAADEDFLP